MAYLSTGNSDPRIMFHNKLTQFPALGDMVQTFQLVCRGRQRHRDWWLLTLAGRFKVSDSKLD